MSQNNIADLLKRGIDAAREGRKAEARALFEQVTDLDENNEKAWFWLASVVETDEERRICLSNVVHINPNNDRAKRALEQIEARLKDKQPPPPDGEEVIAGVTRRQFYLIAGGGGAVILLLLLIAVIVISGNQQRESEQRAQQTQVALQATNARLQQDQAATANAFSTATADALLVLATETQLAIATPTRPLPTLPPTWTPTPIPEVADVSAEPEFEFPVPLGLNGVLAVWGSRTSRNNFTEVGYYNLSFGNQYQRVGNELGADVSLSFNGQRMVYTRYDDLLFTSTLEAINLNGSQVESIVNRWQSVPGGGGILTPKQPSYGPFGQSMVFIGRPQEAGATDQVFLLNLNPQPGEIPVRRLTRDSASYAHPVISPDGSRIAVVRIDPNQANPVHDIVSIDIATGGLVPISNDGTSFLESHPRWTTDGLQVIYASSTATDPNRHDIYIRTASATSTGQRIYQSEFDNIHPVLSPDGRYIAFASNRTGVYNIYIYDQRELQTYQLTNNPWDEFPGDWKPN